MPTSPPSAARPPAPDLDLELDGFVAAYEAAARDRRVDPAAFLPPAGHPKYHAVLRELVRADLEFGWERGDAPRVEDYRARFPSLFADPAELREVAVEEFRLRRAAGDEPDPLEYRERFGLDLFESAARNGHPSAAPPPPPETWSGDHAPQVGDTIPPGFVLEAELGAGAFGRVFLARQADLAGRPVAVKVSSRLVGESQTLARLQHTNIMPVYSAHRVGRFTALVMPFLGRTTLADLLHTFRGDRPASGKAVVSTLVDRAAGTATSFPAPAAPPTGKPADPATGGLPPAALDRLNRLTFEETVLWIGAELADGLAHAHERGILHRDIKPANVLFTDDGRPMLLDFNLAGEVSNAGAGGDIGGTIRYMAPEQLAALREDRGEYSVQSDVYSLGLVLAEVLAGRLPFDDPMGGSGDLLTNMSNGRSRRLDPARLPTGTAPAVASILAKSLAPNRGDRYAAAADLREDLLRQLANRPLKFAPNPSPRERVRKWARRHPRLSSSVTLGLAAAGVLAAVTAGFLARQWRLEVLEAERARDDLHAALAFVYSSDGPAAEARDVRATAATALEPYHTDDPGWTDGPLLRRLSADDRAAVRQDVSVLMAKTADLIDQSARGEPDPARRAALRDEVLAWRERADRTADREGGESALSALHGGRLVEKAVQLRKLARDGEPRLSVWMTLGSVEANLDRPAAADEAFSAAVGLAPQLPWPYLHRGLARYDAKRYAGALADFDRFLELRPGDPDGLFNRGLARLAARDARGAVSDFDAAERQGLTPNKLYVMRADAKAQAGDKAGADRDRQTALGVAPADPRSWAVRGELKLAAGDAKGALADFDAALALDPDFLPALRDKASVLAENLNRPADAVAMLDRVLGLATDSLPDRAGRAALLARLGRKADARRDAAACGGCDAALPLYQAACGYLIAADGPDDTARGLALLRAALRLDPTWAKGMPTDPDLKGVHADPAFRELVAAAGVLAK